MQSHKIVDDLSPTP